MATPISHCIHKVDEEQDCHFFLSSCCIKLIRFVKETFICVMGNWLMQCLERQTSLRRDFEVEGCKKKLLMTKKMQRKEFVI